MTQTPRANKYYVNEPIHWPTDPGDVDALIVAWALGDITIDDVSICMGLDLALPFDERVVTVSAWMADLAAARVVRAQALVAWRGGDHADLKRRADETQRRAAVLTNRAAPLSQRTREGKRWHHVAHLARRRAIKAEWRLKMALDSAQGPVIQSSRGDG